MNNMLKYLFIVFLWLAAAPVVTLAQTAENATTVQATTETGNSDVEMADTLRRDGKIYVVVAVIATVLAGLIIYLIRLDRKVARLEQQYRS
ncbi:hypothetical protein AHMF7605_25040 [Adhaeribacter arboris]|uniref:CcmD family protein n=1 Tax=Adhaeribacter arboris TaxID=2072846 RepID=A0A2T2YLY7_9BACT|nr:hypothetical protein [Adhaeribacter arboris]PSR56526.1 hypothetical protein AHMF7605_25040 [Adhaeribacter arboris]